MWTREADPSFPTVSVTLKEPPARWASVSLSPQGAGHLVGGVLLGAQQEEPPRAGLSPLAGRCLEPWTSGC